MCSHYQANIEARYRYIKCALKYTLVTVKNKYLQFWHVKKNLKAALGEEKKGE
jgi:hypothetical protein